MCTYTLHETFVFNTFRVCFHFCVFVVCIFVCFFFSSSSTGSRYRPLHRAWRRARGALVHYDGTTNPLAPTASSSFIMAPSIDRQGYWGRPTSTLDWCEENYVVSFYIAEFCK